MTRPVSDFPVKCFCSTWNCRDHTDEERAAYVTGLAQGERAATERIVEIVRESRNAHSAAHWYIHDSLLATIGAVVHV